MLFTRRELLTGIGGGSLAVGGFTLGRRSPAFSKYTYAAPDDDTDDRRLRVAWYETYNGEPVGTDGGATDDATLDPDGASPYTEEASFVTDSSGPVVAVGNVLPGDAGTLVVGIEVADVDPSMPLDVWFRGSITDASEHDINGPERAAGDTTPDRGELGDDAVVEVWLDGSPLRGCNGVKESEESIAAPLVARSSFTDAFAPTANASDADGVLAFDCLAPGALRCVALRWELPAGVGNRSQGDSLGFEFAFAGGPCDGDSPFAAGGAD